MTVASQSELKRSTPEVNAAKLQSHCHRGWIVSMRSALGIAFLGIQHLAGLGKGFGWLHHRS